MLARCRLLGEPFGVRSRPASLLFFPYKAAPSLMPRRALNYITTASGSTPAHPTTRLSAPYRQVRQAAINLWTVGVAIAFLSSASLLTLSLSTKTSPTNYSIATKKASPPTVPSHTTSLGMSSSEDVMLLSTAPGRPGTLTAEQEQKLRDFWVVVLQVFGVISPSAKSAVEPAVNGSNGTSTPTTDSPASDGSHGDRSRADTVTSEKTKKRRLAVFSRKRTSKRDEDPDTSLPETGATPSAPGTPASSAAAEDKYDQKDQSKLALASQSPDSLRAAFWSMAKHDHPDALLLRFLRARKWDVENALIMLVSTMHWRSEEMHVDAIMKEGEGAAVEATKSKDAAIRKEAEDFLRQIRMGKSYLHGLDKDGRPICICRARLHEKGQQTESSLERYTVYLIETARLTMPQPVDTACLVFDMSGFSMANMDYGPVKFMIKCFEANYPESLGVVLVHKAPWIFQGIWAIIRNWLDPVVAAKVNFTRNIDELEAFIPRTRISKAMGGDEDWTWSYEEPIEAENRRMNDAAERQKIDDERRAIVEQFERETQKWVAEAEEVEPIGREAIKRIEEDRNRIAEKLAENYWRLDPYIRARTIYDRTGMIGEGGKLSFYQQERVDTKHVIGVAAGATTNETNMNDVD